MKLTTKGKYGLKAIFDLALSYGEGPVALKEIADKEQIAEKYLEQLLTSLKKHGLVNSTRGSRGGYELTRPPKEITVNQILLALEGDMSIVDCLKEDAVCGNESCCSTRTVWKRISDRITDALESITLQDMLQDYKNTHYSAKEIQKQ